MAKADWHEGDYFAAADANDLAAELNTLDARVDTLETGGPGLVVVPRPTGDPVRDTAAIQAAIDDAFEQGGGAVKLYGGQTYVVQGVVMRTNVLLDLQWSTLRLADGVAASVIQTENYDILRQTDSTDGPADFSIVNGTLDGNKDKQQGDPSTFPPVLGIYGRRYTLDNLMVTYGHGTGIDSQWSTHSPFLPPNGFESYITRVLVHSCRYDGINFRGPHDTFMQNFFIVKCGEEADAAPLRFPDSSGRANGTNVDKFHIYGGNGYDFGLLVNTGGLRVGNFVVEGAQQAQVLVQSSQVMLDGFHLYTGGIAVDTARGIQFGDAEHPGVNGCNIRGNIENCGGGWGDVTYLGWNNHIDVTTFLYGSAETAVRPDLSAVGTWPRRNSVRVHAVDQNSTFAPTVGTYTREIGPRIWDRIAADDYRNMLEIRDVQTDGLLYGIDFGGRPYVAHTTPPYIAMGEQLGVGGEPAAAVSVIGKDHAGTITVTTGAGAAAGQLAVMYYSSGFGQAAKVVLTPKSAAAASLLAYVPSSNESLALNVVNAPAANATYSWDYIVVGGSSA